MHGRSRTVLLPTQLPHLILHAAPGGLIAESCPQERRQGGNLFIREDSAEARHQCVWRADRGLDAIEDDVDEIARVWHRYDFALRQVDAVGREAPPGRFVAGGGG